MLQLVSWLCVSFGILYLILKLLLRKLNHASTIWEICFESQFLVNNPPCQAYVINIAHLFSLLQSAMDFCPKQSISVDNTFHERLLFTSIYVVWSVVLAFLHLLLLKPKHVFRCFTTNVGVISCIMHVVGYTNKDMIIYWQYTDIFQPVNLT